ncbi:MAG: TrkA family potassium uptake protein [Verrucomicrobia bacterium]|nr:TrkA family potassium uptake protein [Verrucomicrobiota bacterium]
MRIVFLGASELAVRTTRLLLERRHEVVIIERERAVIDQLSDELDCGFLHGDGSRPDILREAGPTQTDLLFCLTNNDLVNIIASVIAKSLGFKRMVTKIEYRDYWNICHELGLTDTIIPTETISRYLADLVGGQDILELSTFVKGEARFFSFTVKSDNAGTKTGELDLPGDTRVICLYRHNELVFAEPESKLRDGDEVVMLTRAKHLGALRERYQPVGNR